MALAKLLAGIGATSVFAGAAYVTAVVYAPAETFQVSNDVREARWEQLAATYDRDTKSQEFYLGIGRMRRKILANASGRVLEVGAGTAINTGLHPSKSCTEVIFTDRAGRMVDEMILNVDARAGVRPTMYWGLREVAESDPTTRHGNSLAALRDASDNPCGCGGGGGGGGGGAHSSQGDTVVDAGGRAVAQPRSEVQNPKQDLTPAEVTRREAKLLEAAKNLPKRRFPTPTAETLRDVVEHNRKLAHAVAELREHQVGDKSEGPDSADAGASGAPPARVVGNDGIAYGVCQCTAETLPFPSNSFDTVVDMFGLCSYNDPVEALKEMSRVCKPGGRILMLEHGRGTWKSINNYLNKWAPRHARSWGCWWNRDIRRFIRLSGAKVTHVEVKHFGTTQYYILEPAKSLADLEAERLLHELRAEQYREVAAAERGDGGSASQRPKMSTSSLGDTQFRARSDFMKK